MADEAARDALFLALEAQRDDYFTLAALADWFEESGDAAPAACFRWVVRTHRRPGYNVLQLTYGRFYWELEGKHPVIGDPLAQLPQVLWRALDAHDEGRPTKSFKSYKSVRLAYLALAMAWEATGGVGATGPS
jgi:hypothetical protein